VPGPRRTRYERYVAIGDSSTEGLDDPDGLGGYRGWANRLAERVAAHQGGLLYANLAVRGLTTRQVRQLQLARAVAMRPELATVFAGTNDVVARGFDPEEVACEIETMQRELVESGATVLTFTLPDLTPVMPLARLLVSRVLALNAAIRDASARAGAVLVDIAAHPVASDPRLWSDDRLHANAAGHARIAQALAHALGIPGSDDGWSRPLPPASPLGIAGRVRAEVSWSRRHLLPWVWRSLRGHSSSHGRSPKRPELAPVERAPVGQGPY